MYFLDSNVPSRLEVKENVLSKPHLINLVNSVDSNSKLDEDVSKTLIDFTDEYVDNIISRCVLVCRHRGSKMLTQNDTNFILNYKVPPLLINKNNIANSSNTMCSESINFKT